MTTTATYTKLRSGDWGLRIPFAVTAGEAVTVTKKSGESKIETVGRVLWSGSGISLCSIGAPGDSLPRRRAGGGSHRLGRRTGCACGSREHGSQPTDCWTCRFDRDDC